MRDYLIVLKKMFVPFVLLMVFAQVFMQPVWDHNQDAYGLRYAAMMSLQVGFSCAWLRLFFSIDDLIKEKRKRKR